MKFLIATTRALLLFWITAVITLRPFKVFIQVFDIVGFKTIFLLTVIEWVYVLALFLVMLDLGLWVLLWKTRCLYHILINLLLALLMPRIIFWHVSSINGIMLQMTLLSQFLDDRSLWSAANCHHIIVGGSFMVLECQFRSLCRIRLVLSLNQRRIAFQKVDGWLIRVLL